MNAESARPADGGHAPRLGSSRQGTLILLGLVAGAVLGLVANAALSEARLPGWLGGDGEARLLAAFIDNVTRPVGRLFLNLLLMSVVPLVVGSLFAGLMGMGDPRTLGRIGGRSLIYCLIISVISVVIGISMVRLVRPADRIDPEVAQQLRERYSGDAQGRVAAAKGDAATGDSIPMQVVQTLVPTNPFASIARQTPNLLHVMVFVVIFGIAATMLPKQTTQPLLAGAESLAAVAGRLIELIMLIAPLAVACLIFSNVAEFGLDVLAALGWFVATAIAGMAIHMFGIYSIAIAVFSRMNPLNYFARLKTVMITAFSTSSSNATLPTAIAVTQDRLNVPPKIASFVLTVGATANQNGTALFEGVAILFLANLAGVELTLGQQITVAFMAILGGIGTAGVPGGSIPFVIVVLATIGVDPTLIGVILGVDRLLDMCRTVVNVVGDVTAATYVARAEINQPQTEPATISA